MSIAPRASSIASVIAALAANPSFGVKSEIVLASAMTYDGGTGLTTYTLATASSSVVKLQGLKQLAKAGALVMKRVSGTPSAAGEFAITGSTLSIKGNVTASGDTYTISYPTA